MNSLIIAGRLAAPSLGYAAQRLGPIAPLSSATINGLDVSRKRPATLQLIGGPDPKRLRLSDFQKKSSTLPFNMARFRRRTFRRRPRRSRRFRRKRGFRRTSFKRAVKRVIFRTLEKQQQVIEDGTVATNLAEGDGTTRTIYVQSPLSGMLHGDEEDRFHGNEYWLKSLGIRGVITMDTTTPPATGAMVRITLLWSKDQGDGFQTGFTAFGNTTTATTNPAQTSPDVNPRFFMNTAVPFVGLGYIAPFDTTRHRVIKSWLIPVNPSGDVEGSALAMPTLFKCYVTLNKKMQVEDALQAGIAGTNTRYKNGTYWWVVQCIAGNASTPSADTVCVMRAQSIVYYRDL